MLEVSKNDPEALKPKEGEGSADKNIGKAFEKEGEHIAGGMEYMAKQEVDAVKKDFSPDELNNPAYNQEFTRVQKDFTAETAEILRGPGKPEEKVKALELAFQQFQKEVGAIKGTKEGQDAQRGSKQGENIQKKDEKDKKGNQEFQEALLKGMKEHHMGEAQKQQKAATFLGEKERGYAQKEATQEISDTLAFGPPGHSEGGKGVKT